MHFHKSFILKFPFLLLFVFLVSCSETVNFDSIVAKDQPFTINIIYKSDRVMLGEKTSTEILVGSSEHNELLEWFGKYNTDWKKTIASFEKQNMIVQNDFILYYMGYYVAIDYKDPNGKSHSLNKTVELGSLDFLFD
ncbi:MAG TPA: hypothetical protein VLZ75_03635 [Chitinophagales bacterium]|nr:hypothetical protein [Chitinophagales bacterium]